MAQLVAVVDRRDAATARALDVLEANARVHVVESGREAIHLGSSLGADAVVFDPGVTGGDFATSARRSDPSRVLVAWTPRSSSALVADLLEDRADEVVHGGMSDREIAARVLGAVARLRGTGAGVVEVGPLRIDAAHGEATWDDADLMLTRREREVFEVLAEHVGRNVRREVIYRLVWGYAMARGERSVDVNVKRLRRKLALVAGDGLQIRTQPGVGYRLEVAEARERPLAATSL